MLGVRRSCHCPLFISPLLTPYIAIRTIFPHLSKMGSELEKRKGWRVYQSEGSLIPHLGWIMKIYNVAFQAVHH